MTLRPLGPSVTLTALLRISTPRSILSRASLENPRRVGAQRYVLGLDEVEASGTKLRP